MIKFVDESTWSASDSDAARWIFRACSNSAGSGISSILYSPTGEIIRIKTLQMFGIPNLENFRVQRFGEEIRGNVSRMSRLEAAPIEKWKIELWVLLFEPYVGRLITEFWRRRTEDWWWIQTLLRGCGALWLPCPGAIC